MLFRFHNKHLRPETLLLLLLFLFLSTLVESTIFHTGDLIAQDEFSEFESIDESEFVEEIDKESTGKGGGHKGFKVAISSLLATVLAGLFYRYRRLRHTRSLFLLSSLLVLGFYFGGCPCPISSFQNLWLWALGKDVCWRPLIWFLGLIPVTYFFGRVWCGWVCHLGALQEFIHVHERFSFLQGKKATKIMRTIQILLLVTLVIQLLVTRENLFIHIDPFKVAFNLRSFYLTGWILLGLLLISSLYIYRPFCRSVCPVGLILGWVSQIPGAAVLDKNAECTSCRKCASVCRMQAIDRELNFRPSDCIMCGECKDMCKKDGLSLFRKKKKTTSVIEKQTGVHTIEPLQPNILEKEKKSPVRETVSHREKLEV